MRHTDRRGFTLLEAVVALAIISVTAIGVLSLFGEDQRVAGRARESVTASLVARERLAALSLATRAELARLPDSLAHGSFADAGIRYDWTAAATLVPQGRDLFDLSVQVRWPNGESALRSRRFRPAITLAVR